MIFDISNCNKRCWDCPEHCSMKEMFLLLPEVEFNRQILDSLKASMGMYIAQGGNPQVAEKELKRNAVALSIARKEYLKKYC